MLALSRWKVILVLASAIFGLVFTLPNLLPPSVLETAPSWLPHDKLSLGLDLRRGSYLLMEVDTNALNQERLTNLTEDVRARLRAAQIVFSDLALASQQVSVRITDPGQYDQAFKLLGNQIAEGLPGRGRDANVPPTLDQHTRTPFFPLATH